MFATHRSSIPWLLAAFSTGFLWPTGALAQSNGALHTGHSIPGFHGFESSVPPPLGLSYQNATVFYNAETELDRLGHDTGKLGSVRHLSNHSTVHWLSPWKMFGANYAAGIRVSMANSAPHPRTLDAGNSGFKTGDTYLEPLALYWHGERGYLSLRYGLWLDTGHFEALKQDNTGKGFRTHQVSLGFTYYPQENRLWNLSVLGRYGRHGPVDGLDLHPGDDIVVDWAAGRKLSKRWNAGLVGYGVFQTSSDKGADANKDAGYYGTAGIGLGGKYSLPSIGGAAELRIYQELNSYNHTEGQTAVLGVNFKI
jgi:hypothetical protein